MQGISCSLLTNFYDAVDNKENGSDFNHLEKHVQIGFWHRYWKPPPDTPKAFWDLEFSNKGSPNEALTKWLVQVSSKVCRTQIFGQRNQLPAVVI
jgi:hypothetical protein